MILGRRELLLGGAIGAVALLGGRSARALTLAERAGGWIDVRDFGARGNGVAIGLGSGVGGAASTLRW